MQQPSSPGKAVEELIERCRAIGMRRTHALQTILELLLKSERPLTAQEIADSPPAKGHIDPATVYRLLIRLEEQSIVRRLGLRGRASYYAIRHPHSHDDYLVCTSCGSIDELKLECPVKAIQTQIAEQSGYQKLDHELEFFGICPTCSDPQAAGQERQKERSSP